MVDRAVLLDLAKRCEEADKGGTMLEMQIATATGRPDYSYTRSLDAAMTLLPDGNFWQAGTVDRAWATVWARNERVNKHGSSAATPALALTAAALRALAAMEE